MLCPGATAVADSCVVTRKNCVTCYRDDATDIVYIQVQSNGMPDHCYNTIQAADNATTEEIEALAPQTFQMDFRVKWNQDVLTADYEYTQEEVDSASLLTDIVCGINTTKPQYIPTDRGYETTVRFLDATTLDGVVALMKDNTFMYRAVNMQGTVEVEIDT